MAETPVAAAEVPLEAPATALMAGDDEAAAAVVRRIPTPVLRPELDGCVPTGVEIGADSRIVVMMDGGGVGTALVKRLEKLGAAVLVVDDAPTAEELTGRLAGFAPVHGVFWLPALDTEDLAGMDFDGWRAATRVRAKLLYTAMRHAAGAFLVTGTRLGGRHGYDAAGALAPLGGAVTGFAKAYKREHPDVLVKAVDFPPGRKTAAPAEALIAEALRDPAIVEVGHLDGDRWTIAALDSSVEGDGDAVDLGPDTVFVITGAAGSIVSAITADLARAAEGGTFHLLDLAPPADAADPDVAMFASDRDALKRTLFERIKEQEGRATPAQVEKELAAVERRHASVAAAQAIAAAGGTVHYHQVDLRGGKAMAAALEAVQAEGRVDVLIHAGGLEISRLLPDKEPAEFDLVFDVKADGWFHLMKGLADVPVGAAVAFSSIAGRYGNAGQTDYSAANDLLCKSISHLRTARPGTRGVAIDWTAWADIGMATRGSIPTVMRSAGIDMLPAAAGIPIVRQELMAPAPTREVVIAGELGVLDEEWHPTGGVDPAGLLGKAAGRLAMVGEAVATASGLRVTTTLDPGEQAFLYDHQIDGTPVLPGVMGIEAFAETARLGYPDLAVWAVEDVDFHAPFKFYRHEPRTVTVEATFTRSDGDVVAECRLVGERTLAGQEQPQRTVHFTGRVRLASQPPELPAAPPPERGDAVVDGESIYGIYFHGPAYQVLTDAWRSGDVVAGLMPEKLPANHVPDSADTIAAPRLLELCFQTAGIWEIGTTGNMALPRRVERYVPAMAGREPAGRLHALVTPGEDGAFAALVVDEAGSGFGELTGYRTVQLPGTIDDARLAPLRNAMSG